MKDKVFTIIRETLNLKDDVKLTEDTLIRDDLHADSIDSMELIVAMEDEFKCRVDDEELIKIKTIGDILRLLEKSLKK